VSRHMASALNNPEVLARELNASPESFIAGIRFDLRWDSAKLSELCEVLQPATKQHAGSGVRFLSSGYTDPNATKEALQLLSAEYLMKRIDFVDEAVAFLETCPRP